jgi:hypothetical protein
MNQTRARVTLGLLLASIAAIFAALVGGGAVTGAAGGVHFGDADTGGTVNQRLSTAQGDIALTATGTTCQNANVASGTVGRGCLGWETPPQSACGSGKYAVISHTLWNPTTAQGGANGTNTISGIFYDLQHAGFYYSVPDGATDGLTPLFTTCHPNTSTAKWEVAGYGITWCIYLVPNSGSVSGGGC